MDLVLLILIGLIGGLVAGLMGIGGGIIFTPVLFFLFEQAGIEESVRWSVASGLLCTFTAALSSTTRQYIQKNLFVKEGVMLGILGAAGVFLGRLVLTSPYYSREEFVIFFSLILFYAAYMMFRRGQDKSRESDRHYNDLGTKELIVTGGLGGFIAALAGVGGGGIMVPVMNLFYNQPFKKAVSVSHLGMTILIFSGILQLALIDPQSTGISKLTIGYVDLGASLPLALGGLAGGFGGTYLNQRIPRKYLQWGFAILAVVMSTRLLTSVF